MRYELKQQVNECRDFHLICQTNKSVRWDAQAEKALPRPRNAVQRCLLINSLHNLPVWYTQYLVCRIFEIFQSFQLKSDCLFPCYIVDRSISRRKVVDLLVYEQISSSKCRPIFLVSLLSSSNYLTESLGPFE